MATYRATARGGADLRRVLGSLDESLNMAPGETREVQTAAGAMEIRRGLDAPVVEPAADLVQSVEQAALALRGGEPHDGPDPVVEDYTDGSIGVEVHGARILCVIRAHWRGVVLAVRRRQRRGVPGLPGPDRR